MCGITGFCNQQAIYTNQKKWNHILESMKKSLKHRGPDEEGTYLTEHVGLAHTRLSIIDLTTGRQPMSRSLYGASYTIVYNGEIYNMPELRLRLQSEGFTFSTTSDTEVILNGILAHGMDFIKELNGIFAFALWNPTQNTLTLCRDRLGVKPLFYTISNGTLVFGSEIKALFEFPGVKAEIDSEGFSEIFALGPAKSYGKGVFKNIFEVLPGHYCTYHQHSLTQHTYWTLEATPHTDSYSETVHHVRELVYDSICKQMLSDIPICTFLSGGVDSSLVSAICAKELEKSGNQLHTFSFDFVNNEKYFSANAFQPSRDRPYVDIMVKHIKSYHTYLECDNEELADYLYKAVDARDLPGMADVESSLLYFCQKTSQYNKVALTGECADEIFGGYPWFHSEEAFRTSAFPWSKDMSVRTMLLTDDFVHSIDFEGYAHAAYEKTIAETPHLDTDTPEEARRREIAYLNIKWFMVTLLDRMDRTSMYSGLEARVPFADHRILEYVFNVPWDMKCKDGIVKSLLREAGREFVPDEVLFRRKSPYPKTYNPAYERLLGERLLDVLSDPSSPIIPLVDRKKVQHYLQSPSDYGKPWYGQLMAGPQLLAYLLQVNYWLKKYKVTLL